MAKRQDTKTCDETIKPKAVMVYVNPEELAAMKRVKALAGLRKRVTEMAESITDSSGYISQARESFADNECEIDDNPAVSPRRRRHVDQRLALGIRRRGFGLTPVTD